MSLKMKDAPKGATPKKERPLIPAGQQMARIVEIIDLGLQPQRPYQGEEKPPAFMLRVTLEFPQHKIEVEGEQRPMWESIEFPLSRHEKSKCVKYYNTLDPDNEHQGDWEALIGKACFALIVHNKGKGQHAGKVFANIGDILPPMDGVPVPELENPTKVFDLVSPDMDTWELFPEWLQTKIKGNLQYEGSKLEKYLTDRVTPTAQTEGAEYDPDLDDSDEDQPW